jgi:hypothetical protein
MSYTSRYDRGDWIADCDVCGRKFKASQLVQRWDGLMCCDDDWEIRQPQDFVRGVADTQIAPWLRPEPSDSFIPIHFTPPADPILVTSNNTLTLNVLIYTSSLTAIDSSPINSTTIG